MYSNSIRAGLLSLAFLLVLSGCDSKSVSGDQDDRTVAPAGDFTAQISGAVSSRIQGQAMSRSGGWDGSAFLSSLGCEDDWEGDGEDDWDDGFMEDCDDESDADGPVFLSLELIPDGANPDDPNEVIFLGLEGVLAPGSYPITGFDWDADDIDGDAADDDSKDDSLFAWGDYFRLTADEMVEEYAGATGTLTIASVSDQAISGSFAFSADRCLCMTKEQADEFEAAIDALFENVDGNMDDEEAFEEVWDEIEAQFEALLSVYVVERAITVDGSFVDVPLSEEMWDEDDGYEDDDSNDGGNG